MSTQQISRTELAFDPMDLISGEYSAANGYPHRQWTHLRRHAPVFRVEGPTPPYSKYSAPRILPCAGGGGSEGELLSGC